MVDVFSPEDRSKCMSRIRSYGNKTTEICFIRTLRKFKITGWRRYSRLPGKPDFIFRQQKVAIFIDGDFWHGNPRNFRMPTSNVEYWEKKIQRNRRRDRVITKTLVSLGWKVVRVWESSLRKDKRVANRLRAALDI